VPPTAETTGELWQLSALELAALTRSRQVSCREAVEAHLARIDAVNPAMNAVVIRIDERALESADAADRAAASAIELPPLHGVPFTVKDSIDLAGTPTTQGARVFAEVCPTASSPDVQRLQAAGAIPVGRTNLATIAVRWHCESELWGSTINPWNADRTPGASSGGDAVAVATGMTPLGLGSDGLGSLRWPAQCCGIAALKPTPGRIPSSGDEPLGAQLMVVDGPLARRVADLRVAFEAMAGVDWRDPRTVPAPLRGPTPAHPVRAAAVEDPAGQGIADDVREAVRAAADALSRAGYVVDDAQPPAIADAANLALSMLNTADQRARLDLIGVFDTPTQQFLTDFYAVAGEPDPVTVMEAFTSRHRLQRQWGEFQATVPLIVAPICTEPPFVVGTDLDPGRVSETIRAMRMAISVNALGLPAVAVPVGSAHGLPQVVQIIGPRYREDLCLEAAAAVEQALGTLTPIDLL
jgi:amidase